MLTYEDCVGLSDLTEEEIAAIAEHEHIPRMAALELGSYLVHTDAGIPMLRKMILDDIAHAESTDHVEHALKLRLVLRHFVRSHPEHKGPRESELEAHLDEAADQG